MEDLIKEYYEMIDRISDDMYSTYKAFPWAETGEILTCVEDGLSYEFNEYHKKICAYLEEKGIKNERENGYKSHNFISW